MIDSFKNPHPDDFDDETTTVDERQPLVDFGNTPADMAAERTISGAHRHSGEPTGVTQEIDMSTMPETRSAARDVLQREVLRIRGGDDAPACGMCVMTSFGVFAKHPACPEHGKDRPGQGTCVRVSAPEPIPSGPVGSTHTWGSAVIPPRKPEESRSLSSRGDGWDRLKEGVKFDGDKLRFSLIPNKALRAVVRVLEYGARKYAPGNWRKVPDARTRYYDAAHRHIGAWWDGEKVDPETGEHHLSHAICCLLFLAAIDLDAPLTADTKPVECMSEHSYANGCPHICGTPMNCGADGCRRLQNACAGCGFAKAGSVGTFVVEPGCPVHEPVEDLWHGYRKADAISAWRSLYPGLSGRDEYICSDLQWNDGSVERALREEQGLRRPDEPDYKPLT